MQGYCHEDGGACQRFPILIGEIGSRMRDCRNPCNNRGPELPSCMRDEMQACLLCSLAVISACRVQMLGVGSSPTCIVDCKLMYIAETVT